MKLNSSTIVIVVTACIVAGGAYFFIKSSATEPSLSVAGSENEAQVHFQTLVSQLQPISLDTQILSDPSFLSLKDITVPVAHEQPGRPDPFAPIAGLSAK